MSDQTVAPSEAEVPGQEQQQADQEPQFLTRADLEKEFAMRSKDIEEQAFRRAQSLLGKQYGTLEDKFSRSLEEVKSLLSDANVQLTPEQQNSIEMKALMRALRERDGGSEQQNPAQGNAPLQQPPQGADDPINLAAVEMWQKSGVEITTDENNMLNQRSRSGAEYLLNLAQLIASKQASASNEETASPEIRTMGARGSGTPSSNKLEQLVKENKELLKDPVKNRKRIMEIDKELAKMTPTQ